MDDVVFVDSCIWASFFAKPHSIQKKAVDALIDVDRVAIIGPVVTEVLLGFRRVEYADWVFSFLLSAHYVQLSLHDWRAAASLGRRLAAQGHKLPLADLAIVAVAQRLNAFVFSTDPHFDLISDLKRFSSD